MKTKKRTRKNSFGVVDEMNSTGVDSNSDAEIEKLTADFTKHLYYIKKLKNNLLGEYNSDGEYTIADPTIIEKLIRLPKKFENQEKDSVYLSIKLDDFVLNFRVDLDLSYSYCDARLWLIEIEQGIEEDIKHTTELDRVVEVYSQDFRSRVFEKWNVYYEDQEFSIDEFLKQLLRMQHEEYLFNQELFAILAQLYLLRMTKFLEGFGELGQKILLEYRSIMESLIAKNPAVSIDYIKQKEILDQVFIHLNAVSQILKNSEGAEIYNGYMNPIKNIKDKKFDGVVEPVNKKKEKEKSSEPIVKKKSSSTSSVSKPAPKIDYSKIFNSDKAQNPEPLLFEQRRDYVAPPPVRAGRHIPNLPPRNIVPVVPTPTPPSGKERKDKFTLKDDQEIFNKSFKTDFGLNK